VYIVAGSHQLPKAGKRFGLYLPGLVSNSDSLEDTSGVAKTDGTTIGTIPMHAAALSKEKDRKRSLGSLTKIAARVYVGSFMMSSAARPRKIGSVEID
jgi:hypothetical protein